ncbi:MAG: S4 domain-containing protein [Gammaproteobacteria bacterium]|nr:S4 domain-containing protein [Gammaproteobacteria bacterium]
MIAEQEKQRLDKWLWAARFYKTRALATEAVSGGKVHLNGDRVKPGRTIQQGDRLTITKGLMEFDIVIQGLSQQRRPAKEAQQLYQETDDSIKLREERAETLKATSVHHTYTERRPSKKDRRQIVRFKRNVSL